MMHFPHFNGFEIRMFFIKGNLPAVYSLPSAVIKLMLHFIIVCV